MAYVNLIADIRKWKHSTYETCEREYVYLQCNWAAVVSGAVHFAEDTFANLLTYCYPSSSVIFMTNDRLYYENQIINRQQQQQQQLQQLLLLKHFS